MSSSRWTSLRSLALAAVTSVLAVVALPVTAVAADEITEAGTTTQADADDASADGDAVGTTAGPGDGEPGEAVDTGEPGEPADGEFEDTGEPGEADEPAVPADEHAAPADEPTPEDVSDAVDELTTVTLEGTLVNLALEAGGEHADLVVETLVEVDGAFYPIPEEVPVEAGVTGQAVEVALAADADLDPADAMAIATADAPAPGADAQAPVTAAVLPEGEAEVLAVTGTGGATAAAEVLAEAATGSHTLTVVPVYWTEKDSTTTTSLGNLAKQTAQYWSEQSGGRIAISTSVRGWTRIPDPGGCGTAQMMNSALSATGLTTSSTKHVLVYFPKQSSCNGWAGLASIGGGTIWVNGAPIIDVFTHEFGHNLGLGHANTATCTSGGSRVPFTSLSSCTLREYADTADVMGYAIAGKASGNLNTAFADYLGLATVVRPTTSRSVTVNLAPLASTAQTRAVAIPVSGGTIYVDFRPATGRDVRQPAWAGVQVHLRTMDPNYGYPKTYLLDMKAPSGSAFASPSFPVGGSWSVPGTGLVVTVESVGSTARVSVTPGSATVSPGSAAVQRYVEKVYRDLFGRGVDPSGLQTWTTALLSGTPRVAVANAITSSREYRSRLVTGSYRTYLGRGPDGPGREHWLSMLARGMTIQQMEAGFISSDEYYAKAGGTPAGWVTKLYRHVLGRTPARAEVQHWTRHLAAGTSRYDVAMGFLLSTEHLTSVVNDYYVDLLGRGIDPVGRTNWVRLIQTGSRVEQIIGGIVASDEYFNKP